MKTDEVRINNEIKAPEMRVILPDGENLGVVPTSEALAKAKELELDLIEVSPMAKPPVGKIADFGRWAYEEKKKDKEKRQGSKPTETKNLQIKIGTGEHDLELKAGMASKFLTQGHRVKLDLYLRGRAKYMKPEFHRERMDRILNLISVPFKVADDFKKSPKGMTIIIERTKSAKGGSPDQLSADLGDKSKKVEENKAGEEDNSKL